MKTAFALLLLIGACLMAPASVLAQPPEDGGKKGGRPPRGEMRERMLREYDKDGDGKLNEEERKAARDAREQRMLKEFDKDGDGKLSDEEREAARQRRQLGEGRGERGPGDRRRGPGDERRRDAGRGPGGPRGPHDHHRPMGGPPLPPPDELFEKFDADDNDSLSREEFNKLADFVKEHHQRHGPPHAGHPPGFEDRRPEGRRGPRGGDDRRERWREERGEGAPRGDRPRDGERRRGDRERRFDGDRARDGDDATGRDGQDSDAKTEDAKAESADAEAAESI
jgi:hypothetical protein